MRAGCLLGLCFLGCATGTGMGPASEARAGIQEANQLLIAAALVGNGDRVATVFADDGTILPFGLKGTIHGHVAIAEYWRNRLAATRFLELELNTTAWYGGSKDGKVQTFISPGLMFGKFVPYAKDPSPIKSRFGFAAGAAFQTVATTYRTYNHSLIFTGRLLF